MNLASKVHKNEVTSVAYVPQEAWIFGGTIRENILIGREFVKEKYEEVIEACSLGKVSENFSGNKPKQNFMKLVKVSDLKNFKNADLSLVREKGLTLSGGQRARINLARALYTDAEIYLLDDPLAAVDTKVRDNSFIDCERHQVTNIRVHSFWKLLTFYTKMPFQHFLKISPGIKGLIRCH